MLRYRLTSIALHTVMHMRKPEKTSVAVYMTKKMCLNPSSRLKYDIPKIENIEIINEKIVFEIFSPSEISIGNLDLLNLIDSFTFLG